MGVLAFRRKGQHKMEIVPEQAYIEAHREEELHQLIADNPALILRENSDGQLFPALTIGSHFRLGNVEADLLVVDLTGSLFVVEVKRDRTPRDVVAQILDYAGRIWKMGSGGLEQLVKEEHEGGLAGVLARILADNPEFKDTDYDDLNGFTERFEKSVSSKQLQMVIVSYSVDEDVQRTVEYLRSVHGIDIYCVEFDYYSTKDHEYLVPEIIAAEGRRSPPPGPTQTQEEYRTFWEKLLLGLKQELPDITRREPSRASYQIIPLGHGGIHFEWGFHGRPRDSFEVGLHFERAEQKENQRILEEFRKDVSTLEKEIGEKLVFQETWGKRWARLYAVRNDGHMSDELETWAVDTMVKFHKFLKPRLDGILRP